MKTLTALVRESEPYGPDLYELRLDRLEGPLDLAAFRRLMEVPLIATDRRSGGLRGLLEACDAGFDYVDLETSTPGLGEAVEELKDRGAQVIVSLHLGRTPTLEEAWALIREMRGSGADLCKLVGFAHRLEDNLLYLNLTAKSGGGLISFAIGRLGILSRLLSPLLGGAFTYASPPGGPPTAEGQLPISKMRAIYRLLEVS